MSSCKQTNGTHKVGSSAIRRAVASSTAIETGQRIDKLESKLRKGVVPVSGLSLAKRKRA